LRRTGPTQPRDVRRQRRIQPWSLIPDCYGLRREEGNCEDWGLICGEIRAESYNTRGATVPPWVLFTPRVVAAVRVWRGAGNAGRGASPTADKREGFSFSSLA
jgi:hypothetical protein